MFLQLISLLKLPNRKTICGAFLFHKFCVCSGFITHNTLHTYTQYPLSTTYSHVTKKWKKLYIPIYKRTPKNMKSIFYLIYFSFSRCNRFSHFQNRNCSTVMENKISTKKNSILIFQGRKLDKWRAKRRWSNSRTIKYSNNATARSGTGRWVKVCIKETNQTNFHRISLRINSKHFAIRKDLNLIILVLCVQFAQFNRVWVVEIERHLGVTHWIRMHKLSQLSAQGPVTSKSNASLTLLQMNNSPYNFRNFYFYSQQFKISFIRLNNY